MIDSILDFSIDHAALFVALLMVVVLTAVSSALWAYGRYHERATRRRGAELS